MKTYTCPKCNTPLNVNGFLVFTVKNEQGKCGIVLLSDELGNYNVHHHPNFSVEKGDHSTFYCPACSRSLSYQNDNHLVRIFMVDEEGEESTVVFSAIFGENATFQISEKRQKSYGELISKFKDPGWYLKEN